MPVKVYPRKNTGLTSLRNHFDSARGCGILSAPVFGKETGGDSAERIDHRPWREAIAGGLD
jgi:hypothetical protein